MFIRKKSLRNRHVLSSYCMKCGLRIGASSCEEALDALEKSHQCITHRPDPPPDLKPIRILRNS
jgi:hypothetical protein